MSHVSTECDYPLGEAELKQIQEEQRIPDEWAVSQVRTNEGDMTCVHRVDVYCFAPCCDLPPPHRTTHPHASIHTRIHRPPTTHHQVKSSVDYAHGNWLTTFMCGALNYQVTHHLFPTVSQVRFQLYLEAERSAEQWLGLP